MLQIIQNLKSGDTILEQVPAPEVSRGCVLIKTSKSLVSLGTEKMLVEFGKSSLISKARQQPDRVKEVLDKIKSDGLMPTLEAVFNKLDQPLPLGYCNVGNVIAVGEGVTEFNIGDRVASNGNHAEVVCVPKNLVAHIPDNISDSEAAFTVIGSIGLQGIRLLQPTIGETMVVVGLGLIGLITAQLLIANGCNVIGVDVDDSKLKLAETWGVKTINGKNADVVKTVLSYTKNIGADGVLITASTKGDEIIAQAAKMSRKRGRIILVGVIGLNISRADFYEKELTFQVSCSYGPGRYDENYEKKGSDYPLAFVRWTEKRNFETILNAISNQKLNVTDLITEEVELKDYLQIYGNMSGSKSIASIMNYPAESIISNSIQLNKNNFTGSTAKGICIIGAGNFTKMTMLPILKKCAAPVQSIVSANGLSGTVMAKKYGIPVSSTNYKEAINSNEVGLTIITTRHNLHAEMVMETLKAGKHVFVEKPLAINKESFDEIVAVYQKQKATINVGFNRRFSPHSKKIKSVLPQNVPLNIVATMNAGFIPPDVWVHDLAVGGGRIIGEACHFIDLATYFTGSKVKSICMNALEKNPKENTDNASILLKYENGSNVVINYFSNGSKAYSKERLEIYFQEKTIVMDNFRTTEAYGIKGFSNLKTKQDKGHTAQFELLTTLIKNGGDALIPFDEIANTTLASFAAIESLKTNAWVNI
jgi:predicted dehydrogenase/threonine dehydrogenase-like Zn-dependent dehydrogenase